MINLKDWWDDQQSKFDRIQKIRYLANSPLQHYLDFFGIQKIYDSVETILEIGVGTGRATNQMIQDKKRLSLIDISKKVLNKFRDRVEKTYLLEEYNELPFNYFDLVISHLVAQHITNDELLKQIKYALNCLKDSGVFVLQFANVSNKINPETFEHCTHGGIFRSPQIVEKMIADLNGKIIHKVPIKVFNGNVEWHGFHIQRNK